MKFNSHKQYRQVQVAELTKHHVNNDKNAKRIIGQPDSLKYFPLK